MSKISLNTDAILKNQKIMKNISNIKSDFDLITIYITPITFVELPIVFFSSSNEGYVILLSWLGKRVCLHYSHKLEQSRDVVTQLGPLSREEFITHSFTV